jgi:hypothetical protein
MIGCALLVIPPANGQPNPAGWQDFLAHTGPQQTGRPYLHLVQAPAPQPSHWREHVDTSGLAAATHLVGQLQNARVDVNIQAFMNYAAMLSEIVDRIVNGLPENTRNASRAVLANPPRQPAVQGPPAPNQPVPARPAPNPLYRAHMHQRLTLALNSAAAVARFQAQVAKAIIDFKVALMPVRVSRMLLSAAVLRNPLAGVRLLKVEQETHLGVHLMLMTAGGTMASPRGIARSTLHDIGIYDEELEDMLTVTIRGTTADSLHRLLNYGTNNHLHLQTSLQQQIFDTGLKRWLTSEDLVVHFTPEETGPVGITHPDVVAITSDAHVLVYPKGTGILAKGISPGLAKLSAEMKSAFKELTSGRAEMLIQVVGEPDPPSVVSPRQPPPNPNVSPTPGPTPTLTPGPTPAPAPSSGPAQPAPGASAGACAPPPYPSCSFEANGRLWPGGVLICGRCENNEPR